MIKIWKNQHRFALSICFIQIITIIGLFIFINGNEFSNNYQIILLMMLIFSLTTTLISGLVALQNNFAKKSWEEKNDTIFTNRDKLIFPIKSLEESFHQENYRRFHRFIIPISIFFISFIEIISLSSIWNFKINATITPIESNPFLPITSFCIFFAIIFFLLSKYLSGLAYHQKHHFLLPIVSRLFFTSILLFLIAITFFTGYWKIYFLIPITTYLLAITIIITAIERIILWFLNFYRPKIKNDDLPVYESKVLSLFSHSDGLLHSFSDIIEYQFGIKVNDKLINIFFKRYLIWAIFFQIFIAFCFSSIIYISEQHKGIKKNILSHKITILEPGLYISLPYPFVLIERLPNKKILKQFITHSKLKRKNNKKFLPWAVPRNPNSLQIARGKNSTINLVSYEASIFYTIEDHYSFLFENALPQHTIQLITKQEINNYLATHNFKNLITNHKFLTKQLITRLNKRFQQQKLGIHLKEINLNSLTPPATISDAYKQLLSIENNIDINYMNTKFTSIFNKESAEQKALNIITNAQNVLIKNKLLYQQKKKYFSQKESAFKLNPKLYKTIKLMDLLEKNGNNPKIEKIIILSNKDKIINLDLKGFTPEFLITK